MTLDDIKKKYSDVAELHVLDREYSIIVSKIVVSPELRSEGIGTKIMNDISAYADSVDKPVSLTPSTDFGGKKGKLDKFYKGLGFKSNKGRKKDFQINDTMVRPVTEAGSFKKFIKSLKRDENTSLVESILTGYRYIFEGVSYPNDFNPNVLDELPSFAKRKAYAESKLPRIAAGSSRIVYGIDNNHVLKLAKNSKGIAQNDAESDGYVQSLGSVVNIIDESDDGIWLISERVDNIKKAEFEQLTGVTFEVFCDGLRSEDARHNNHSYSRSISDNQMEELYETELWHEMLSLILNADLQVGDLCILGSYGKSTSGHVVLRDAGFTLTVQKQHYR